MNGDRIKLARKKAGLSLRGLAETMGGRVSAQAIGKYERDEMSPGSEAMLGLSEALGVSLAYLMTPQRVELDGVEFRAAANLSAKDRARVEVEAIERIERYSQIEEILNLSGSARCFAEKRRRLISSEAAERLADDLRREWQLGIDPIPNMTELLEEKGVKILLADLPVKVSGVACLAKRKNQVDEFPAIAVNRERTLERRRFSMAHELGHLLIDSASGGDIEHLCHRFAESFLVNRDHLMMEIGEKRSAFGVREIMDLKRLYRVPAADFLLRLERIGALDRSSVEYAFRSFAKGWRDNEPEPLEDPKETEKVESPKRFERLVYRAVSEDMISLSKAVELLRAPLTEIEKGLRGPAGADANRR